MKPHGEESKEIRKKISNVKGFSFDENAHRYLLDGTELVSGTTLISRFKKPFESGMISSIVARKYDRDGRKYLTSGKVLRKYWRLDGNRAAHIGTAGHEFCEMMYLDPINTKAKSRLERNAQAAMRALMHKFNILNMEVSRGNRDYMLGYTIDIEMQHKVTGEIFIGDFKFAKAFTAEQSKKLKKIEGKNPTFPDYLLPPFRELKMRNSTYNSGEIQLNLYKHLYERDVKNKVAGCLLIHIDGALDFDWYDKGYAVYPVRDLSSVISNILKPVKRKLSILDVISI